MISSIHAMKQELKTITACRYNQGYDTKGLQIEIERLPDSYDALAEFAERLNTLKHRTDWKYVEPETIEEIRAACPGSFTTKRIGSISPSEASGRTAAAFEASVAGCILGKPLEFDPTLEDIRKGAESIGEWPIADYVSEKLLDAMKKKHPSASNCCRENISYVAQDDDLNYTVIGMRMLEEHGLKFTRTDLGKYWLGNLPIHCTWGPERKFLIDAGMRCLHKELTEDDINEIVMKWNPNDEACGAAIRVDSYGFACPGLPALAAELAWRDASMTHRHTGVYASMYVAAAIAAAPVADDPRDIFEAAISCIPAKSRFSEVMQDSLKMVYSASDWLEGYSIINRKYGQYRHCQLYQECAQLMNTARFAKNTQDAICMQVSQGCDTDCFAKIAGSIMGAYFGPGHLPEHWIKAFKNDFRTSLAEFEERSFSAVTERISKLPSLTLNMEMLQS